MSGNLAQGGKEGEGNPVGTQAGIDPNSRVVGTLTCDLAKQSAQGILGGGHVLVPFEKEVLERL